MTCIGIEVEVESTALRISNASSLMEQSDWIVERDGSLRGGVGGFEVKSDGPQELSSLHTHLTQLYPVLQGSSGNWRAAVHVHVDVRDYTWMERGLALALGYVVDEDLFNQFSPERMQSNFCVPLANKMAPVMDCLSGLVRNGLVIRYGKYSSINVQRMTDIGTIEFRHMRTPEAGTTVSSVTTALGMIESYASACARIVNCARFERIYGRRGSVAEKFLVALGHLEQLRDSQLPWVTMNSVAIGDVLTVLDQKQAYDTTQIDVASLAAAVNSPSATPRLRRTLGARPTSESDQILDDLILDSLEDEDLGITGGEV